MCRDHVSYSGSMEVGTGLKGTAVLSVVSLASSVEGTGDMTCALSMFEFDELCMCEATAV